MREAERSCIHIIGSEPRDERGEVVSYGAVNFLLGGESRRLDYGFDGQMCEFANATGEFRVCDGERSFLFIFEVVE